MESKGFRQNGSRGDVIRIYVDYTAAEKKKKDTRESPSEAMLVYFHRAIRVINYSFITRRRFADILSSYRSAFRKTDIKVRGSGCCALSGDAIMFQIVHTIDYYRRDTIIKAKAIS